ncbi:hypothetical protein [Kribbella sp. NPDC051770]|uniref:hypothetical protein n=1 Tax=Kribbella sp. NPDC051770 TaxID=3155413 RepID=UPI003441629F
MSLPQASKALSLKAVVRREWVWSAATVLARVALAAGFLAVADRFGWWGPIGTGAVGWGDFAAYTAYAHTLSPYVPDGLHGAAAAALLLVIAPVDTFAVSVDKVVASGRSSGRFRIVVGHERAVGPDGGAGPARRADRAERAGWADGRLSGGDPVGTAGAGDAAAVEPGAGR